MWHSDTVTAGESSAAPRWGEGRASGSLGAEASVDSSFAGSPSAGSRARWWWEIAIVLALSVGASAVYSLADLVHTLLQMQAAGQSLSDAATQLNPPASDQAIWDAIYRLLSFLFSLAPVALVLYLLWQPGRSSFRMLGLDFRRFGGDLWRGLVLVAVIGVPGLALYAAGRALGITVAVQAAPLDAAWWTIPLLLLRALGAGLIEEVVVVGYLFDRLRRIGWSPWVVIVGAAVLRGLYHSYQGFGPVIGNVAMGLVFGWCYRRWGRVMPLVIAHTVIDVIAFVGYPLAAASFPTVF